MPRFLNYGTTRSAERFCKDCTGYFSRETTNRLKPGVYGTRQIRVWEYEIGDIGGKGLLLAEYDAAPGEIVGGEFHFDLVAGEDADEVFAHLSRDVAEDFARGPPLLDAKLEHRVGQRGGNGGVDFDGF